MANLIFILAGHLHDYRRGHNPFVHTSGGNSPCIAIMRLLCCCFVLLPLACRSSERQRPTISQDIMTLSSLNQEITRRYWAFERLCVRELSDSQVRQFHQALGGIVADGREHPDLIIKAASFLVDYVPDEAAGYIGAALPAHDSALKSILVNELLRLNDTEAIPYLLLDWQKQFPRPALSDSSQWQVITQLAWQDPMALLEDVVMDAAAPLTHRLVALRATVEMTSAEDAAGVIGEVVGSDSDIFLQRVRRSWLQWAYLPCSPAQLMQMEAVFALSEGQQERLRWAHERVFALSSEPFNPRDMALLLELDDRELLLPRQLADKLARRLQRTVPRPRERQDTVFAEKFYDFFNDYPNSLRYNDMLLIDRLLDYWPSHAADAKQWIKGDSADYLAEWGGVLESAADGWGFTRLSAWTHGNDRAYGFSSDDTPRAVSALAWWHFHADLWYGRELAGASLADIALADFLNTSGIVITAVNRHTINLDFFTPEGVIIDLGTY